MEVKDLPYNSDLTHCIKRLKMELNSSGFNPKETHSRELVIALACQIHNIEFNLNSNAYLVKFRECQGAVNGHHLIANPIVVFVSRKRALNFALHHEDTRVGVVQLDRHTDFEPK